MVTILFWASTARRHIRFKSQHFIPKCLGRKIIMSVSSLKLFWLPAETGQLWLLSKCHASKWKCIYLQKKKRKERKKKRWGGRTATVCSELPPMYVLTISPFTHICSQSKAEQSPFGETQQSSSDSANIPLLHHNHCLPLPSLLSLSLLSSLLHNLTHSLYLAWPSSCLCFFFTTFQFLSFSILTFFLYFHVNIDHSICLLLLFSFLIILWHALVKVSIDVIKYLWWKSPSTSGG